MSKRGIRELKNYPRFYMLRVTFGYGLFAAEGKHRGSGMGKFYHDSGDLTLYGAENFNKRGGMAYCRYGEHVRFKITRQEMDELCVWKDREWNSQRSRRKRRHEHSRRND